MCLYKLLYSGKEFFDICCGFYLVSKEYHEFTIMEVFKNMKIQQYFFADLKSICIVIKKHKTPQICLST